MQFDGYYQCGRLVVYHAYHYELKLLFRTLFCCGRCFSHATTSKIHLFFATIDQIPLLQTRYCMVIKFDPCTDIDTVLNMKDSSSSNVYLHLGSHWSRSTPFFLLKVLLFSLLSSLLNGSAKSWNHHYCQLLSMMSVIGLLPLVFCQTFLLRNCWSIASSRFYPNKSHVSSLA